jgi:hypothetical protein
VKIPVRDRLYEGKGDESKDIVTSNFTDRKEIVSFLENSYLESEIFTVDLRTSIDFMFQQLEIRIKMLRKIWF